MFYFCFMVYTLTIQKFKFSSIEVQLLIPSEEQLFERFQQGSDDCPYWGQVWPAALALCQYIVENHEQFKDKKVLEIAGGLGLPSLVAAHFAKTVCCSDYSQEAVHIVAESAKINQLSIETQVMDWNEIPTEKIGDIVILSDINYEPELFDQLYISLTKLLAKKVKIILSTPQRLMAKPFIEKLLPFVSEQSEIEVLNKENRKEWISIYVLEKQ